ncbi:VanZ family protein [Paenibacillus caui]|uniref:VanZ family protein n=1 Tax=Paenibacillus caui TaxID=2873927 RepID=UPI001CA8625A|nr:VanZ family protein [Paenibacillus caui]
MIPSFLSPISYAFLTFPIAALLFTLPFLVVQYRKHGYINKVRALVLYLFLLYLMNAFFLVMLPLPASRHNAALPGEAAQLIPLNFIRDILRETSVSWSNPSSYLHLLKEQAFLQVALNILLTVPFGMFLRYYFRTGWIRSIVLSFVLSLSFEVTQLTGIFGFYDHPYRLFDVDDLIMNTFGGIVGFLLAEWLSGLLPRIELLDKNVDVASKRVSYTRRATALLFDVVILLAVMLLCVILSVPAAYWVSTGIYFMLVPYLTGGRTFGKWLVRIRLTGEGKRISLYALAIRYGLLYWVFFGLDRLMLLNTDSTPAALRMLLGLGVFIINLWFLIHVVKAILTKKPLLFYEKISNTKHIISWHHAKEDDEYRQSA